MIPDRLRAGKLRLLSIAKTSGYGIPGTQTVEAGLEGSLLYEPNLPVFEVTQLRPICPEEVTVAQVRLPYKKVWFEFEPKANEEPVDGAAVSRVGVFAMEVEDNSKRFPCVIGLYPFLSLSDGRLFPIGAALILGLINNSGEVGGAAVTAFYDHTAQAKDEGEDPTEVLDSIGASVRDYCVLPCFALQLLTCKNVTAEPVHVPKKLRKLRARHTDRAPFSKVYTLKIRAPMRQIRQEMAAQGTSETRAFHLVRGHFANYDANPLFGKYTGNFWIPAHTRGDLTVGAIRKNYEIVGAGEKQPTK